MRRLYALPYSPWSERARWALDHHALTYREIEHVPLLGEVRLRLAARKPFSHVSVPLLVDGTTRVHGSSAIARYADDLGSAPTLFPTPRHREIEAWDEKSEAVMQAGRHLVIRAVAGDRDARMESLSGTLPEALRGPLDRMALLGTSFLSRKYRSSSTPEDAYRVIARVLEELRVSLRGRKHLLGGLTYADITVACALGFVKPVDEPWLVLGPATRRAWTIDGLAREYADVLAWRDRLYADDRRPLTSGGTPGAPP